MWYIEFSMNDVLLFNVVALITDGPGDMIYLTIFNYTDVCNLSGLLVTPKPGQTDPSKLSRAKTLNLTGYNCTGVFKRLTRGIYVGTWPDCGHAINEHHPFYAGTVDCRSLYFFIPPTMNIYSPNLITLRRTGKRYPMPKIPDSFRRICPRKY